MKHVLLVLFFPLPSLLLALSQAIRTIGFDFLPILVDTQMVKKVLDDVRLTLLKQGLEEIGML